MMPPAFEPGMEVNTAKFGPGTVHEIRQGSAVVFLPALGLMVRVPFDELEFVKGSQRASKVAPPQVSAGETDRVHAPFVRSVEALRFGIVPRDEIDRLTVGYDGLRKWVTERLPDRDSGRPQVSEICGHFGTGKSHTMAAIRHIAAEDGYLTPRV